MAALDHQANNDACPWCGNRISKQADPVVVQPKKTHAKPLLLHHRCETEWAEFIEKAQSVASRGKRQQLLDAPIESGFEIDTPEP